MFIERAKTIFANLGLATIARNKLKTSDADVVCELMKVPTGIAIVPTASVEPVVVVPEVEPRAAPVVAADTVKFVVRIRSTSAKWISLFEPMPNGTIWVYRPYVSAINPVPDSDNSEIVVSSKVARKKGWVT